MKTSRVLLYGSIVVIYLIFLHIFFPPWLNSSIKNGIDGLFMNFFANLGFIPAFIGLIILGGLIIYFGLHFFASLIVRCDKIKNLDTPNVSILISSKNESQLLERTLNSIIKSDYPKDKIQLILIISNSTDDSKDFCDKFSKEYNNIDITILSESLSILGKPAALNYGLKQVKHDLCIVYDAGVTLKSDTLTNLILPMYNKKYDASIGPVLVKNWKQNYITRAGVLDYGIIAGGSIYSEVKNKLGSSCYLFGRNFCIRTSILQDMGGFNEESLTEDLYLTALLVLNNKHIHFVPNAKSYDYMPYKWDILKKQRTRWVGGYVGSADQIMEMKVGNKSGAKIMISRNLSMLFLGHVDVWIIPIASLTILFGLMRMWYLFSWFMSWSVFVLGYIINGLRKYGDKHYTCLFFLPVCAYLHLHMFISQFFLPDNISWEKTPMILEKSEEEIELLAEIRGY